MGKLPWYRMWTESRNDSKLDALNDREFRIWHKLLCFSAEHEPRGVVDYIDPEFVAMELRIGVDELESAISRMTRVRLVERDEQFVYFPSFTERQYDKPSDHPDKVRERVRRHRAKKRGETRYVTPTDTELDTEGLSADASVENLVPGPHPVDN